MTMTLTMTMTMGRGRGRSRSRGRVRKYTPTTIEEGDWICLWMKQISTSIFDSLQKIL